MADRNYLKKDGRIYGVDEEARGPTDLKKLSGKNKVVRQILKYIYINNYDLLSHFRMQQANSIYACQKRKNLKQS